MKIENNIIKHYLKNVFSQMNAFLRPSPKKTYGYNEIT